MRALATIPAAPLALATLAASCTELPSFACERPTDCAADETCRGGVCVALEVARDAGAGDPADAGEVVDGGDARDAGDPADAGEVGDAGEVVDAGPPPSSCADVLARDPSAPSGAAEIFVDGVARTVECDMTTAGGGWSLALRYVEGDACPGEWVAAPVGGCARSPSPGASSASAVVAAPHAYSEVRGAVRGLGFGGSDAFRDGTAATIDGVYVDGVTITAGTPRSHVFTLAHGVGEDFATDTGNPANCPCAGGTVAPVFVGAAFACEAARDVLDDAGGARRYDVGDTLWDGALVDDAACVGQPESAATFQVARAPSSDALEVRVMSTEPSDNEDTAVTFVELWVR